LLKVFGPEQLENQKSVIREFVLQDTHTAADSSPDLNNIILM